MQSVSADLANAILAAERQPLVRLRVDWNRNGNYSDTYQASVGGGAAVDYNLLEGAFLGATDWQQLLDPNLCPPDKYRYITIDWNRPTADLADINAQHPSANILAYQNFAGMRVGPHGTVGGQERATSLITYEDADGTAASAVTVDRFTLTHAGSEGAGFITRDYRIEGRLTGTDAWTVLVTVTGNTNNNPTHVLGSAATVRHLRIYVTDPNLSDSVTRIYDFQARNGAGGADVAAGKPVVVSGTCNANEGADKLVDGNTTTKWCDNTGVAGADQAWAIVSLVGNETWFLHASNGTRKQFGGFPDLYAANVSSSSWRTAASQHFAALDAAGYDGVMLDDLNMMKSHWSGDIEFATDNAYRDAAVAAVAVLKTAADSGGLLLNANVGADPWNSDQRAGFTQLLVGPKLHIWNRESYLSWSSGTDTAPWTGGAFADTQSMVAEAEAAGVASQLEGRQLSTPNHSRSLRYGLAAFYLEWGGSTASSFAYRGGQPASIYSEYRQLIGTPTEAKQLVSGTSGDGAWMRHWTGGVACVNAKSTAGLVTFTLGGTYLDPSNASVTSVQLDSGHGMVLLDPDLGGGGTTVTLPLDDLSADVVSIDLSRELATDIPAQAKLFSGSAAAQATITLAHQDPTGDPARHGAWKYSPLNSASPLFGYRRKGAPATLELGFVTTNGPEYVTVLTGTVRSLQVTSGGRQAVMLIEDRSATMRKQVQLPAIIADGETSSGNIIRPGLNTTFLADWVARKCGYYASPPPRANCLVSATHHGSGYPEVGAIQHHNGEFGSKLAYSPTPGFPTAAKFVQAVNTDGSSGQEITYILSSSGGTTSTNNGGNLLWEGWRKFNSVGNDQPLFIAYVTGAASPYVSAFWQQSTGRFTVTFQRTPAQSQETTGTSGPSVSPGTSAWHYWAVQVSFTSTGADVTFRYDGTTTGPIHVTTATVTGQPNLNTLGVARGKSSAFADDWFNGLSEADQLTTESTTSTWNNAFVPTAQIVPHSAIDNRLVATPNVTEDGWTLFQQIAESEFATAGFTETGVLFYWSRRRWTTAPYTTSQRTLTASTALKELETVEAADQVRNRVVIRARTPTVEDSQTVWKLGSRWTVPASGSISKIASLNDPVGNVDTTVVYGTSPGSSRYLAGTRLDGQGDQVSNLTITLVPLSPTAIAISITNPNAFTIYMAGDENASATYSGKAYLWIDAQKILFSENNGTRVQAPSSTSISNYGEQLLEIEDSDLRQDDDDLQQLANDLRDDLADPGPALSDVPAVGDPRLQLGDRVTIVDPEGLALSSDFHISKLDLSLDGEGLGMVLGLRKA